MPQSPATGHITRAARATLATISLALASWGGAAQATPAPVSTHAGWVQGLAGSDGGTVYMGVPIAKPP